MWGGVIKVTNRTLRDSLRVSLGSTSRGGPKCFGWVPGISAIWPGISAIWPGISAIAGFWMFGQIPGVSAIWPGISAIWQVISAITGF